MARLIEFPVQRRIRLVDDGTLDTVLKCSTCRAIFRFNFHTEGCHLDSCCSFHGGHNCDASCYDNFVADCMAEVEDTHVCEESPSSLGRITGIERVEGEDA